MSFWPPACALAGHMKNKDNIQMHEQPFERNLQYYKFCAYGFLKNLRFYEPFLMLFFLEKGLTFFQIGGLYAAREILINVMEIPSGLLADVMGRKRAMIVSFLAYIVSFLVFYFAQAYWLLFAAMALYAFGDAFRTGTHKAMIFDYLKERGWSNCKTHYYGNTRAWSQRGAAVSALIAAILVHRQGSYAPVFLLTIVPYLFDLFLVAGYPKALDGTRGSSLSLAGVKQEFATVFISLIDSFKKPDNIRSVVNQALHSGFYKASKDYLQPLLKMLALGMPFFLLWEDKERTAVLTGVVYSVLYALTSFASSQSGPFSKKFKNLATPLNATMIVGISLGLLSGAAHHLGFTAVAVILYFGIYIAENLRKPMGIAYVSEGMNQKSLASALSVESQTETFFSALIAIGLGFFSSLWGLGQGLAFIAGLCLILAVVFRLPQKA